MNARIEINQAFYDIDLSQPLDISIPISNENAVNAWYVDPAEIEPQQLGDWVGSTKKGASVNFNRVVFNPHSHGTHTESVAHILSNAPLINETLNQYFFTATLISIEPEKLREDLIITKSSLQTALQDIEIGSALMVRMLPNIKKHKNYANSNWPYFTKEAMQYIVDLNIQHLLVDTPSVDKEKDGGKLVAHHTYWQTSGTIRSCATITEFIYVANTIADGNYILNLQVASFVNNAAPSRPILYKTELQKLY